MDSSLGATIDFPSNPSSYDFSKLSSAGVKIARFGIEWGYTETTLNTYQFAWSDQIIGTLINNGIRPLVLLNTSNSLYDSVYGMNALPQGSAMTGWLNFVKATVNRNKGKNIIWEIFNEPNTWKFWLNQPTPAQYADFATQTIQAIRTIAPNETIIGFDLASYGNLTPTIHGTYLDYAFPILTLAGGGPAQFMNGISIHPYRNLSNPAPESANDDYRNFRRLLANALGNTRPPMVQGESGWNVNDLSLDYNRQARFLVRQHLIGQLNGIPYNVIYKLIGKPNRPDDDFGVYASDGSIRPAAVALKFLSTALNGFQFNKAIATGQTDAYALLFSKGSDAKWVVWSKNASGAAPVTIQLPVSVGTFTVQDIFGNIVNTVNSSGNLTMILTNDSPIYLTASTVNTWSLLAQNLEGLPPEVYYSCPTQNPITLKFTNPLSTSVSVRLNASDAYTSVPSGQTVALPLALAADCRAITRNITVSLDILGYPLISQSTILSPLTPFNIGNIPSDGDQVRVEIQNLAGRPFSGTLRTILGGISYNQSVSFAQGEYRKSLAFTIPGVGTTDYTLESQVLDANSAVLTTTGNQTISKLAPSLATCAQGSLPSELSVSVYTGTQAIPSCTFVSSSPISTQATLPLAQVLFGSASITRSFFGNPQMQTTGGLDLTTSIPTTGGNFFINTSRSISTSAPQSLGYWIATDQLLFQPGPIPLTIYIQLKDSSGQIHQIHTIINGSSKWQYVEMSLNVADYSKVDHWGGLGDGIVHYPVTINAFTGVSIWQNYSMSGHLTISNPVLIRK